MLPEELQKYVGQCYTFEDGNSITVLQIKRRDEDQYWVTYAVNTGPGVPARFVLQWEQFKEHYGHLFTTA
jgi:hypothetical protein